MSKLETLREKNNQLLSNGKIQDQHNLKKKTARERIELMLDAKSFVEIDKYVSKNFSTVDFEAVSAEGEGVVCGYGTIDGRPIFLFAQDFTVLSGSLSVAQAAKIVKTLDNALKNGVPVIGILDSLGARIAEGVAAINSYGSIIKKLNDISGVIPTIAVIAGPCVGAMTYVSATCDFTFMIDDISYMALNGPQIYESAMGKKFDNAKTIGALNHNENTGVAQFLNTNEEECFADVKKLLSYLPSNNLDDILYEFNEDDLNRQLDEYNENFEYDAKELIAKISDNNMVFEYGMYYSKEIITAFGRINGNTVGFVANANGSFITGRSARKASRFISLLDAYNIPVITIVNTNGTEVDLQKEKGMLITNVARLINTYGEAGIPKITLIAGNAVGDGYLAMCPKSLGADIVLAWPNAVISSIPVEMGGVLLVEENTGISKDNATQSYEENHATAFAAARQGVVDDIIEPASTRQMIASALEMTLTKRESKLPKKHSIMPL